MKEKIDILQIRHFNLFTPLGILFEALFIALAVFMSSILHPVLGDKVFLILPMHWAILFAGMIFGWEAGLIAGLSAPVISHLVSGMPMLDRLPLMVIELAVYGFTAGFFTKKLKMNAFLGLFLALVMGRIFYVIMAVIMGKSNNNQLFIWIINTFKPGLIGVIAQIIILPLTVLLISYIFNGNNKKNTIN